MALYNDEGIEAFGAWLLQEQAAALEAAATTFGAESMRQSHRFNRAAAAMGALHDYRVFRGRGDGASQDLHPEAARAGLRLVPGTQQGQREENQQ